MIKTNNLNFKDILFYPDMEIESNKLTFIVGKSGVGKSALIRIFNATNNVSNNSVFIDGIDINSVEPITLRRDLLLCGQNVYLYPGTILDNFKEIYKLRNEAMPTVETLEKFLELACVPFDLNDSVNTMSGGERQRVYLAIYISLARKIIMFDEPTSALDSTTSDQLMSNLANYAKESNMSIIVISHDQTLAQKYADAIIDLENVKRGEING